MIMADMSINETLPISILLNFAVAEGHMMAICTRVKKMMMNVKTRMQAIKMEARQDEMEWNGKKSWFFIKRIEHNIHITDQIN
jgi:hypothetical protein